MRTETEQKIQFFDYQYFNLNWLSIIFKKSDPTDERVTILEMTPKAKRTLKNIEADKDARMELILKNLSHNEKLALLGKVKRILRNGLNKG